MKQKKLQQLFTLALCIGAFSVNAQTAAGKLVLNKGQKFQVDNTLKSTTNMEMMGQSMEILSDVVMQRQVEVKDKTQQSSYLVTSTIKKMVTNGSAMGQSFSFDSDKKEDAETEIGKVLSGQVNVPKDAELSEEGKAINIKKDSTKKPEAGGNPMMAMMGGVGGGQDESGTAELFQVLPAGKKTGDTWSDSTIGDGIKTYKTYTIKEIKGNDATVIVTGTQQTNKVVENQGMEVNITMDAKLTGEAIVDITTGIAKQKTMSVDGTGSADVMGQSIPMTTKVTSTTIIKGL